MVVRLRTRPEHGQHAEEAEDLRRSNPRSVHGRPSTLSFESERSRTNTGQPSPSWTSRNDPLDVTRIPEESTSAKRSIALHLCRTARRNLVPECGTSCRRETMIRMGTRSVRVDEARICVTSANLGRFHRELVVLDVG